MAIDKDTGIDIATGRMCGETTKHAQLGTTGSCLCGLKKYAVEKAVTKDNVPNCAWCDKPPEVYDVSPSGTTPKAPDEPLEVFCATEGCPAFSNVVSLEKWGDRAPHVKEVMWVPSEEPVFYLRGRDPLAQAPVWTWIDIAEKKKVPEYKLDAAVARVNEMVKYEREVKSKLPD